MSDLININIDRLTVPKLKEYYKKIMNITDGRTMRGMDKNDLKRELRSFQQQMRNAAAPAAAAPAASWMRTGSAEKRERAAACNINMGEVKSIPEDELIYIIASHGAHISQDIFTHGGNTYGRDSIGLGKPFIKAPVKNWENLNLGVLVSEGTVLIPKLRENRQQAVKRHVKDIVSGNIKVFQRFPWKIEKGLATFPNIILGEGLHVNNPFVSTIARYYKTGGKAQYDIFQLYGSVFKGNLTSFSRGFSPDDIIKKAKKIANDIEQVTGGTFWSTSGNNTKQNMFNQAIVEDELRFFTPDKFVSLHTVLNVIQKDVISLKRQRKISPNKKTNIVFATCLEDVPQEIHNIWIGKNPELVVNGGGWKKIKRKKRKKRRKSRKRLRGKSRRSRGKYRRSRGKYRRSRGKYRRSRGKSRKKKSNSS